MRTVADLKTILAAQPELSHLTLPEIDHLTEQIAQVIPAGNIPGLILNGLHRLEGRRVPAADQQRYLGLLFRGVRDVLNKAVYHVVFAGPAAILLGYQKLLQLAGKDVETAFPDGTWQFYVEFALREDTARHANETIGFQSALRTHKIALSESDTLAAWIMASLVTLRNYDRLLENEWRERVYLDILARIGQKPSAYADWEKQRPYVRGHDAGSDDYPTYRRRKFDAFFSPLLAALPAPQQTEVRLEIEKATREALPAYQRQMSILARLDPNLYQETRLPYTLAEASLAVIDRGHYSLIPATTSDIHSLRAWTAALASSSIPGQAENLDVLLAEAERTAQITLRAKIVGGSHDSLEALGFVPLIINSSKRPASMPLAAVRKTHRGIGDHALTLFFTEDSTVFDQSHIFFDGAWGAALAEIMTSEALAWALYLAGLPPAKPAQIVHTRLLMPVSRELRTAAPQYAIQDEASAENTAIRLGQVTALRRLFKTRNDLITVTVNDLLVLYRSIHGGRYRPASALMEQITALQANPDPARRKLGALIAEELDRIRRHNPAILIPMDGSLSAPHERLYPTTFRNPMVDFLSQHESTLAALRAYQQATGDRSALYARFDELQRQYLRMIASFGVLMRRYKEIALSGQSLSTASIKLLAHVPPAIKRLLDEIPGRLDMLNEVIKGEEVFSNIGRVAKGSTLRRFITAKDDNRQKTLAWGIITDDQDVLRISLRDFRPHVAALHQHNLDPLANLIARDFLDAYAEGFNQFVRELREITIASRETRHPEKDTTQ